MSNDIELLACPFCGAGVTQIRESHNGYHVDHWCEKHKKVTIQCTADDLDSAKNLWNNRAVLDDLVTIVRRLVHALHKAAPTAPLSALVLDYLERKGFNKGPFRDACMPLPPATPSVDMNPSMPRDVSNCQFSSNGISLKEINRAYYHVMGQILREQDIEKIVEFIDELMPPPASPALSDEEIMNLADETDAWMNCSGEGDFSGNRDEILIFARALLAKVRP